MNEAYRELMLARTHAAVGAAKAIAHLSHPTVKGQLREIVIRDLLRPLLPADVGVGTGQIISATGSQSAEQDVVIFDKRILPPILFEGARGIFPVESVLSTIEVKSKLTRSKLEKAHKSAVKLRSFDYVPVEYDEENNPVTTRVSLAVSMLLAFDTDLRPGGKSEDQRYDEVRGSDDAAIRNICVVGRGFWAQQKGEWVKWPQKDPLDEVVSLIAITMNSYRRIAASRTEPRLGRYLFDI